MKNLLVSALVLLVLAAIGIIAFVHSESWDACKGNAECIQENISERESGQVTVSGREFFLSSIYRDKRNRKYGRNQVRNELFVRNQKTGAIQQLTFGKSHISSLAYSAKAGKLVFAQSHSTDPFFGYLPAINSPGKFRDFQFLSVDLKQEELDIVPLNSDDLDQVPVLGFDRAGEELIYQTIYDNESFQIFNLNTNEVDEIVPESFHFGWHPDFPAYVALQKIDSENNDIYFKALDGYVSKEDSSFLYNLYKLNLDTKAVDKITDTPFYRSSEVVLQSLTNSFLLAPETNVGASLDKGQGSYDLIVGSASHGKVTVLDFHTLWEHGPTVDLAAIAAVDRGAAGTFFYLVLFDVSAGVFTKKSEIFLGDRIEIRAMNIGEPILELNAKYRITVQTVERNENEATAATRAVEQARTFYVADQVLKEISD